MSNFSLKSSAFADGAVIPQDFACDGIGVSPPLDIDGVPAHAKSLALVLHDPDAPRAGGFDHWVVYDIPTGATTIPVGTTPAGKQGKNGTGDFGYIGPCPPTGEHRYVFTLYALDAMLDLPSGLDRIQLEAAMKDHVIAQTQLMGRYTKH